MKEQVGWMIVLCPDADAEADGVQDEVWTVIFRQLKRAKEDCKQYLKDRMKDEPEIETDEIEWAEDSRSTTKRRVYFGRPKAPMDGLFYIYQVGIE